MKKNKFLIVIGLLAISPMLFAQDSTQTQPVQPTRQYVKRTFDGGTIINNATIEQLSKHTMEFIIQHRFGVIYMSDDLYGIFAPSNIRLGLRYGVIKNLSVGIGATKNRRIYDLEWKYVFLKQTTGRGIPVTVAYYGDLGLSGLPKSNFLNQDSVYKYTDRFSYFHELMIARKITKRLSLQIAGTYTHLNIVDTLMIHDNIGASALASFRFSPQSSVTLEFDYPISKPETNEPKPNLGIGYEVSTGGHQFQIFVCTTNAIINQETRTHNLNDFIKREILLGFNITRQWGF